MSEPKVFNPARFPGHDQSYDRFVADMAKHCKCAPAYCPCDGVLAGGMCDEWDEDFLESIHGSEDDYERME